MNAWILVGLIVGATAIGDVLQTIGMRRNGAVEDFGPRGVSRFLTGVAAPYLVAAVVFMAVAFFAFLKLLSVAPLSFAVPATALSFVIETVLARLVLKEQVDRLRWAGTLLVACGVALLAV